MAALPLLAVAGEASLAEKAQQIAHKYMLADTHIDVPYRLQDGWVDVTKATDGGDFDYPRAKQGGLDLVFMSVFAPASMETADGDASKAEQLAHELIDSVEAMAARAPEKFMLVNSPEEAEKARKLGRIGLAMGMENASPINHDLGNIQRFAGRGISYITLTHGKSNHIGGSS